MCLYACCTSAVSHVGHEYQNVVQGIVAEILVVRQLPCLGAKRKDETTCEFTCRKLSPFLQCE